MGLRFTDGCDSYATAVANGTELMKKWGSVGTGIYVSAGGGMFGGNAIVMSSAGGAGNLLQSAVGTASQAVNVGFYFQCTAPPGLAHTLFKHIGDGGTVTLLPTGQIQVSNGGSVTSTATVCDGSWHWIEAGLAAGGLWIDNAPQGAFTPTARTPNAFAFLTLNQTYSLDDIVVYDNSTGAPLNANAPLNAIQISTLRPNADSYAGFATLVGGDGVHHYASVDEVSPDGDVSYVQDGTSGNYDLLAMSDLPYTPLAILGAMVNLYVDNPNGGTISIEPLIKSGSTQSAGAAKTTPLSYQTLQWSFPVDPATSAAWTAAALNAVLVGYKNP